MVRGLPWCKDESKALGNAAVTGKILCQKHNSELSELDYAVKQSFDTINECWRLYDVRHKIKSSSWTQKTFAIDGRLLERWFLKTLINLNHGRQWIIGEGLHAAGMPSDELVRIAFGRAPFRESAGLYVAAYFGTQEVAVYPGLEFTPKTIGENLSAGLFTFCGLKFFLSLVHNKLQEDQGARLVFHLNNVKYATRDRKGRPVRSHRVSIVWR